MKAVIGMALILGLWMAAPGLRAQTQAEQDLETVQQQESPPQDQAQAPAQAPPKEDVTTVRVRGLGPDHDEALRDALRKACEKGGHLEIYSHSQTENYALVRDTVLARVTGLIKDYQIMSEGEDPLGGYFVEITARVDRRIIDATWGQVQILLQQMGKPKILVNIMEKIYDCGFNPPVEKIEEAGLLQNRVEELLTEKGFELVDKNQIEAIKFDKIKAATLAKDTAALRQLATELGAEMYITGVARASGPQITDAYGVRLYMWETDVTLKVLWSETGQILFARDEQGTRGGSRTPGPPGAKQAIAKSGEKMAFACLQAILEKWSRQAVAGGKIVLEVRDLDFKAMTTIQQGLRQMEGVTDVTRQWHKPVAKYDITTVIPADKFAEILAQAAFNDLALEILDQKFNTIEARLIPAPAASPKPRPAVPARKPARVAPPATKAPPVPPAEKPIAAPKPPVVVKPAAKPTSAPTTRPAATTQPATAASKPASRPTTAPSTRPTTTRSTPEM